MEQFEAVARDKQGNGDWVVMLVGSPRDARSTMVREAGSMVAVGWTVVGLNRTEITVEHPDEPGRRTEFRVRKAVP